MIWYNLFGTVFFLMILITNIIFAIKNRNGFENKYKNQFIEIIEQTGCFGFMIFNIPRTVCGFSINEAFALYLIIDALLSILYCAIWAVCFKKGSVFRALALSIIPSALFLFSGIISRSFLLTLSALLFAPSHILISYKNAV